MSYFFVMAIATVFWGCVLVARRLKEATDPQGGLGESLNAQALGPGPFPPPDPSVTKRVRAKVAERIEAQRRMNVGEMGHGSEYSERDLEELSPERVRVGDVVSIESGLAGYDADFLVEGVVRMAEGMGNTVALSLADGSNRIWLVAEIGAPRWLAVTPVTDHKLRDEPPRNLNRDGETFSLSRRRQASAACTGQHGRPPTSRVSMYEYRSTGNNVLWLERWGSDVLMAQGVEVLPTVVGFLPGS